MLNKKLVLVVSVWSGLVCASAGCGESDADGPELDGATLGPGSDGAVQLDSGVGQAADGSAAASDAGAGSADAQLADAGGGPLDAGTDAASAWDATSDGSMVWDAAADATNAGDATADAASTADGGASSADGGASSPTLPGKGGTCPTFASGDAMFSPAGVAARKVRLWVGGSGGGPLVIYWHSTGAQPSEAESSGLKGVISEITAAGGVVAAPYTGANDGTFPWLSTTSESLKVADEVVACAVEQKDIDPRRIHALGFSAGGLMTSTMSFQRSAYVASVAPYSGGQQGSPSFQDASNKFAALIFHGGSSDSLVLNFQNTSTTYSNTLRNNGNYTLLCNHGGGHSIPSTGPAAAWRFFQDHPYRTNPSPYVADGVPPSMSSCQPPP